MSANFGMMDEGYFVSKSEIFKWIKDVIGTDVKSIDHLGKGDIYCELINKYMNGKETITDHQYLHNLKLFQRALDRLKVQKKLDILKISKCRYLDNLQTIQWLKRFLQTTNQIKHQMIQSPTCKVNSPRLFTSPNLTKKVQSKISPRTSLLSPRQSNIKTSSSSSNPLKTQFLKRSNSPSCKLADIKNILKNVQKSEQDKLNIIRSMMQQKEQQVIQQQQEEEII